MSDLITVVEDLRAEGEELHAFLQTLEDRDWDRTTTFKQWTICDVVSHLYFGDYLGITSYRSGEAFLAFMGEVQSAEMPLVDFTRQWLDDISGSEIFQRWYSQFNEMCDLFAAAEPERRLTWAGPDMGIKMFATARLMETWAHAWEIYDCLGVSRTAKDRIRHIATIGVKTYGWTFANRQMPVPGQAPYVCLTAPSGAAIWEWNPEQEENRIIGEAVEFCQVVTQVRNIADTALKVVGEPARQWMSIAQCFAGPPEQPPAPGTRAFGGELRRP